MQYELKAPRNVIHSKCLRVFNKNSHNTPVKKYSLQMFKELLINNVICGTNNEYSEMLLYTNLDDWLPVCLYEDETVEDYELVLIMEEKRHLQCVIGNRWLKCCIYDKNKDLYYLRSITNMNKSEYGKELVGSGYSDKWFIDSATMLADRVFWITLAKKLFGLE